MSSNKLSVVPANQNPLRVSQIQRVEHKQREPKTSNQMRRKWIGYESDRTWSHILPISKGEKDAPRFPWKRKVHLPEFGSDILIQISRELAAS